MGFFSKLKDNFQHGGIKITLAAPPVITANMTTLPVQVTVTAGETAQRINSLSVELIKEEYSQGRSTTTGTSTNSEQQTTILSRQDTNQSFDLPAGQTATIDLTLSVSTPAQIDNPALRKAAGIMSAFSTFGSSANNWQHYIRASADVEGIVLDPSAQQRVQIEGKESSRFSIRFGA